MDETVYTAVTSYYRVLEKLGHIKYKDVCKLLVLCFYKDFVFSDYRGVLTREDYYEIEKALNCLYGNTCLIPYPDYLKMGKLHIGEMTEMAHRLKTVEETEVLKVTDLQGAVDSDVIVLTEEDEE